MSETVLRGRTLCLLSPQRRTDLCCEPEAVAKKPNELAVNFQHQTREENLRKLMSANYLRGKTEGAADYRRSVRSEGNQVSFKGVL